MLFFGFEMIIFKEENLAKGETAESIGLSMKYGNKEVVLVHNRWSK